MNETSTALSLSPSGDDPRHSARRSLACCMPASNGSSSADATRRLTEDYHDRTSSADFISFAGKKGLPCAPIGGHVHRTPVASHPYVRAPPMTSLIPRPCGNGDSSSDCRAARRAFGRAQHEGMAIAVHQEPLQSQWKTAMSSRRRKTLVVCSACHGQIHTGQPSASLMQ